MHQPKLLLLDEPTAGVDPKARREFWDEIHRLAGAGVTVLVSTHYMDEAERCHRISYISYGHMLARGTVDEVVAASGLSTFVLRGAPDAALMARCRQARRRRPGRAVRRGAACRRPRSRTPRRLADAPSPPTHGLTVEPGLTSLEDVFIHFMCSANGEGGDDGCGFSRSASAPCCQGIRADAARPRHLRDDAR